MLVVRGVGGVHRSKLRSAVAPAPLALVACGAFAGALAGVVTVPVAVAVAVVPVTLVYAFWLVNLAFGVRRGDGWTGGPAGVLLLAAGVCTAGLSVLSTLAHAGAPAAAGFLVAAALLVGGLLWLPGTASTRTPGCAGWSTAPASRCGSS